MEDMWISREKIGPLWDTVEVIDPHGALANVKLQNAEGKFSLFCSNHILSKRSIFWTLPLDCIITKMYLDKQWIPLIPIVMANHGGRHIVWKIQDRLLATLIERGGWIPVRTAAWRLGPHEVPLDDAQFNANSLKDIEKKQSNIRISPYEDTYMHPSGKQDFLFDGITARIGDRKTFVAHSFAIERRFPGMDIVPLYMYEETWGNFLMGVGNPITRQGKTVNQIEIEYFQSMQSLKEQVLAHITSKKKKKK